MHQIDFDPKTYVVMGMHRSGTSFMGKCLHRNDVDMGEVHDHERYCLYEDKAIGELNHFILDKLGSSWDTPPTEGAIIDLMGDPEVKKAIEGFFEKRKHYSDGDNVKRSHWGFKDPRTAITYPLLAPFLEDDTYLVCVFRKKDRVVNSMVNRGGADKGLVERLYNEYNKRIIRYIKLFTGVLDA